MRRRRAFWSVRLAVRYRSSRIHPDFGGQVRVFGVREKELNPMPDLFSDVGAENGVRRLVERFYDLVESEPRGASLRRLHLRGTGIANARVEQFNFLCGFLGGRRHYQEKHGHMDVRLIHAHVPITTADAEDWLFLMNQALAECAIDAEVHKQIIAPLRRVAMILVNDGIVAGAP
jgi:hemoglobin